MSAWSNQELLCGGVSGLTRCEGPPLTPLASSAWPPLASGLVGALLPPPMRSSWLLSPAPAPAPVPVLVTSPPEAAGAAGSSRTCRSKSVPPSILMTAVEEAAMRRDHHLRPSTPQLYLHPSA